MKTTKRRLERFLFFDYVNIEKHLEKMALQGWQLEKITRIYWQYHKIEPQKLTYSVTFFSEASEFNPYPTENQHTFYAYCKDAGWNLVTEWAQMQIFCSREENPVPIETEETVKLKSIHRAMKKNFIPGSVVIFLLALLEIYLQIHAISNEPVYQFALGSTVFLAAMWFSIAIETTYSLLSYLIWYFKSWKAVNMGGDCVKSKNKYKQVSVFFIGIAIILLGFSISTLFQSNKNYLWGGFLGSVNITIVIFLVYKIKNTLKKEEISRKVNITVTIVSCVVLSLISTGITTWGIVSALNAGWFGNHPGKTYTTTMSNGTKYTWDIYNDPLPLTIEDLQDVNYENYSYEWRSLESIFLAQSIARQDSFPDGQLAPELNYAIVDVKWPMLYDLILNDFLEMYNYHWKEPEEITKNFKRTDSTIWQADIAYQLYDQDEAKDEYILCWDNRIVYINYDEVPTTEQIAITIEKLWN